MTTEPPDLGRPPRTQPGRRRPSWLLIGYGVLGTLSIAASLAAAQLGWVPSQPERQLVPASVRQAPGGYRTFHFWHSGYQGGK